MSTFSIHCAAPCGHVSKLTFDALRLPDETFFIDIPKKRRLRCASCGRLAMETLMSWNEAARVGKAKRPVVGWVVVARESDGVEMRSSALLSRERAMGFAHDLADKGDEVLRIEGRAGCAGRRDRGGAASAEIAVVIEPCARCV